MAATRFIIIGGGIVGLATALKLGRRLPSARITVLEKESAVARHQSGNNSGVLHCGLYYKPGSLKARLAVSGIREMTTFCRENDIPHEVCGKLVVAVNDAEVPRLRALEERGAQNGLEGLKWLSREEAHAIEPHIGGVAWLRVPQEGIVDYPEVCAAMVRKISAQGGEVKLGARVESLELRGSSWLAHTTAGEFEADFIINCAGLHSDRVSELAGERRDVRVVPFRGEYFKLRKEREHLVRNLIYPVQDPQFPFLGVHFTRLIEGGIEAGPNAVLAFSREGYRKTDFCARDLFDALSFRGLWRFMGRHKRMCWEEVKRSFSKKLFCASLRRWPSARKSPHRSSREFDRLSGKNPTGEGLQSRAPLFILSAAKPPVLFAP
ncbi:MAG: L-2-hydroxyglutarate oxidase [Verrucomicrobia bacterium]|nr:L-2-hydroxyglutarate oxidase [Verrucomicrobiota bacterium]